MLLYLERESSKVRESQRTDRYRSRYVLLLWRGVSKCTVIRRIKTSLNGVSRGQVTWIRWPQLLTWLGLEDSLWLSYMEQWQISPWGQRGSQSGLTGWDKHVWYEVYCVVRFSDGYRGWEWFVSFLGMGVGICREIWTKQGSVARNAGS